MKLELQPQQLPNGCLLITCSSHEARCEGFLSALVDWKPAHCILFHYDDDNVEREKRHAKIVSVLRGKDIEVQDLVFTERSAVRSLYDNMLRLDSLLAENYSKPVVMDISVFTKRHLLMMLRWLDDAGYWDRLFVIYSQPEDYDVSEFIPLSFGLKSFEEVPGFSACPDLSRAVHLVLFLGYEGDRALAAYEYVQPMQTTVIVADPPFKHEWKGRSEFLNRDLLALLTNSSVLKADGIDPEGTRRTLDQLFARRNGAGSFAKIICPIGTKPQALGIYMYLREAPDPPAIVYASPLRHNHRFFSHGVGPSWILRMP